MWLPRGFWPLGFTLMLEAGAWGLYNPNHVVCALEVKPHPEVS